MLHVIAKVGRSKRELGERRWHPGLLTLQSEEFGRPWPVPLGRGCRRCQKGPPEPGWGSGCAATRQHPSRRKEGLMLSLVRGQYHLHVVSDGSQLFVVSGTLCSPTETPSPRRAPTTHLPSSGARRSLCLQATRHTVSNIQFPIPNSHRAALQSARQANPSERARPYQSSQPYSPWLGGRVGDDGLRGSKACPPLAVHSTITSRTLHFLPQVTSERAASTQQEFRLKGHKGNRGQPYPTAWRSERVKGAASTFSWTTHDHWRTISQISPSLQSKGRSPHQVRPGRPQPSNSFPRRIQKAQSLNQSYKPAERLRG